MGFTLYHHKDGKVIPIKMSIWDAFHGVPDPKPPKPKPCKCCGKMHTPKVITTEVKNQKGRKGGTNKGGKRSSDMSHGYSTSDAVDWTAEDDATILELKTTDPVTPWNKIKDAIGKGSKSQINERYKELSQKSGKSDSGKTEEERKQDEKKATGERKKAENMAKLQKEGKGGKKGKGTSQVEGNKDGKRDGQKGNGSEIKAWADGFEKKKWIAMASKHYDKTGVRITPEMARKIAEGRA